MAQCCECSPWHMGRWRGAVEKIRCLAGSDLVAIAQASVMRLPCSTPLLVSVIPSSPTTLSVEGTPPKSGGPWNKYTYTAKAAGSGKSVTVSCSTPACPIPGLTPGEKYIVSMTATDAKGKTVPAASTKEAVMPAAR